MERKKPVFALFFYSFFIDTLEKMVENRCYVESIISEEQWRKTQQML